MKRRSFFAALIGAPIGLVVSEQDEKFIAEQTDLKAKIDELHAMHCGNVSVTTSEIRTEYGRYFTGDDGQAFTRKRV